MSKYTPKPWIINPFRVVPTISIRLDNGEHQTIASLEMENDMEAEEIKANAHLMAAAPDMLEALIMLREEHTDVLNGLECSHEVIIRMIDKAISKAKGEDVE